MKLNFKNLTVIFLTALLGVLVGIGAGKELFSPKIVIAPPHETVTTKEESDLIKAVEKAYPAVVRIECTIERSDYFFVSDAASLGSGVIISKDGYIVTNNHVIDGAKTITVYDTNNKEYTAKLIGKDAKSDLAVLKIAGDNFPYAEFADSDAVKIGYDALAIGNPLGTGISVTNGIISALHKEITIDRETMTLFQTNAEINNGNSGGGLFDINGCLIGIVNAKTMSSLTSTNVEGLGYAIPSNEVKAIAASLINDGYVKDRPTIGIKIFEVTRENQGFKKGLYITEILKGSPAEKAGLQTYDRIIRFNGQDVKSYTDLSSALKKLKVGDKATITVIRNDKEVKTELTLTENLHKE